MTIQTIFFDLGDTLVKTNPMGWIPGAKDLIAKLKAKGFQLGIISNTGNLPDRKAILKLLPADFKLSDFEKELVLFSSEVQIEKPNKAIFEKAVVLAKISAAQCLFCSENIIDTLVAQTVGIRSIRTQPPPGNDLSILLDDILNFQNLDV